MYRILSFYSKQTFIGGFNSREMQAPEVDNASHWFKKTVNPLLTGILFFSGAALLTCARALLKFHFIIIKLFGITNSQVARTVNKQIGCFFISLYSNELQISLLNKSVTFEYYFSFKKKQQ